MKTDDRLRDFFIILLPCATALAITPWNNLDAIVVPKFFCLVLITALILCFSANILSYIKIRSDSYLAITVLLIIWIPINLLFNNYSFEERIFGIYGRNLGTLTYLCLFLLLIPTLFFAEVRIRLLLYFLFTTSYFISFYFLFQLWKRDPANWQYVFSEIPNTTLGNPNFVSSYFGIVAAITIGSEIFRVSTILRYRLLNAILGVISVFIVYYTKALQGIGLLLILTTLMTLTFLPLRYKRLLVVLNSRKFSLLLYTFICACLLLLIFADSLQLRSNLGARIDYWHNAFKQTLNSPLVGQGFDTFGNKSLQFRSENYPRSSDSPHNLFLELSSAAGIPMAVGYIFIQIKVFIAIIKNWRLFANRKSADLLLLLFMWIGYHLQSLINPSTIPFLSLGFILTGVLYGQFHFHSKLHEAEMIRKGNLGIQQRIFWRFRTSKLFKPLLFLPVILSVWLAYSPLKKDANFRDGIESGDGNKIILAANSWPNNSGLSLQAAHILKDNDYPKLAELVLEESLKRNRNDFYVWKLLLEVTSSNTRKRVILINLNRLNPLDFADANPIP